MRYFFRFISIVIILLIIIFSPQTPSLSGNSQDSLNFHHETFVTHIGNGYIMAPGNNSLDITPGLMTMQQIGTLKSRGIYVTHNALLPHYFLTVNWEGDGYVRKSPDLFSYAAGSRVELKAIPAAGWSFSGWSGNLTGNQTPRIVTVNGDMKVFATFTKNSEPPPSTVAPVSPGDIGGGAGGGGGDTDKRITSLMKSITKDGKLLEDVIVESTDAYVFLLLPYGTSCLNRGDQFLPSISIEKLTKVPEEIIDPELLGPIYSFLPEGATFSPGIQLTFKYNPLKLPADIDEEKLTIVRWDDEAGEWLEMDTTVDTEKHAFSTFIKHLSYYSCIVKKFLASFKTVDLQVTPEEAGKGEEVLVKAILTNTGDLTGNCQAVLEVDGETRAEKEITLFGREQGTVKFSVIFETSGTHTIAVNGIERTVYVLPSPAVFRLDNFKVTPGTVMPGQDVVVSFTVINSGESHSEYTLECFLNAGHCKTLKLDVPGNSSEQFDFTISSLKTGIHYISINDMLFGEFKVEEEAAVPAPPATVAAQTIAVETAEPEEKSQSIGPIMFIISGVLFIVAIVVMLVVFRSRKSREAQNKP